MESNKGYFRGSGGGNSNMFFMFNPKIGDDSYSDDHIFSTGLEKNTN